MVAVILIVVVGTIRYFAQSDSVVGLLSFSSSAWTTSSASRCNFAGSFSTKALVAISSVYLSEHYWTAQSKDVPAVLRQKKVEQMAAQFEQEGFPAPQHAQFATLKSRDPETDPYATPDFDEAVALDDLREHGLLTDEEIARSNRSDPFAHDEGSAIRRDQFGNLSEHDVSDFFPTDDPWGN
jgi:hypothetical protein